MTGFSLPAVPAEFRWKHTPLDWKVEPDSRLTILAGAGTNWIIDAAGNRTIDNAPAALFTPPDASFLLSARVAVDFAATFDAGVIQVRERDDLWAKLCFEYSPQREPMIVSVVTREFSDDCNSAVIAGNEVYLRLALTPKTLVFHYSLDGRVWHFVRYFTLGMLDHLQVGFSAQSPWGQQCAAVFSEISYRPGVLQDKRSGE